MTSNGQRLSMHQQRPVIFYFVQRVALTKHHLTMFILHRCTAIASLVYAAHPRSIDVDRYKQGGLIKV